ncbi:MAG: homocysteine S-methyltransferase family protein [Polyangiales bacterium]|nr:homocysteine S-methyltransferase family protein [Myxococcales bacterium]MCB9659040.1 homocysteine S-methyltransferase family protein [Sandaracinaceae bacterium]
MTVAILDGPVGTELLARGVETPLPSWSAGAIRAAPDVLEAIHRDYVRAGATIHTANTFRTQPGTLGRPFATLAKEAVAIARRAVPATCRVAGSLAPVADCYRPDLSPGDAARDDHAQLARVLVDAGCDLLLCETFPCAQEAWVAVEECVRTGADTWVGFTAGPDGTLMTPQEMTAAARGALERGATCVLVNCTPATLTLPYVEALAALGAKVGAYANAGRVDDAMGWSADPFLAADQYAKLAASWVDAGATVLGGCCGTGPTHCAALSDRFGRA